MRKKKSMLQILEVKANRIFSKYIVKRDGRCVVCGTTERLTNGHLFSRVRLATKYDELNCHCQCSSCNFKHEHNPYPYQTWFQNKFGMDAYHELYRKWNTIYKGTGKDRVEHLIDIIEKYSKLIEDEKQQIDLNELQSIL